MRQTLKPRTAGARHCFPDRFDRAEHRGDWCMAKLLCMWLSLRSRSAPSPTPADDAHHSLPSGMHMDVVYAHGLLCLAAMPVEGFHQRRVGSR